MHATMYHGRTDGRWVYLPSQRRTPSQRRSIEGPVCRRNRQPWREKGIRLLGWLPLARSLCFAAAGVRWMGGMEEQNRFSNQNGRQLRRAARIYASRHRGGLVAIR